MEKSVSEVNGISITKNLIGINYTKGILIKPKYIVIHDIQDQRFATMREYRNYIARDNTAKQSVHYLVGARTILKILEDDWRGWHVGDKPSKEINNSDSISIAMFIRNEIDTKKTIKNTVELVNSLRNIYGIGINNVVRHYDVTGMECPSVLMNNSDWNEFKLLLKGKKDKFKSIGKGKIIDILTALNIKNKPDDESDVIGTVKRYEVFDVYGEVNGWVKMSLETEEKIQYGYLNKDYVERLPAENELKKEDVVECAVEDDLTKEEIIETVEAEIVTDIEHIDLIQNNDRINENILVETKGNILIETKEDIVDENDIIQDEEEQIVEKRNIEKDGVIVNVDTNLEVRRGPGKENFVVGYLLAAQKVKVVQQVGDWYKIIYQSTIGRRVGYIEIKFVQVI